LTPVEKGFKDFFISYAKAINKMYDRTGSLFQYKFKRKVIQNNNYLLRLVPYIHQNPVRAGLCQKESQWKYSSYNNFVCNTFQEPIIKLQKDEVLGWHDGLDNFLEFHKSYNDYTHEREFLFKK